MITTSFHFCLKLRNRAVRRKELKDTEFKFEEVAPTELSPMGDSIFSQAPVNPTESTTKPLLSSPTAPPPRNFYPILENFYQKENPEIKWIITDDHDRQKIMVAYVPDGKGAKIKVLYDPYLGMVTDRNGIELRFVEKPKRELIEIFRDQVARSPEPNWFRDHERKIRLRSNNFIAFDENKRVWYHTQTERVFSGFAHPGTDDRIYMA